MIHVATVWLLLTSATLAFSLGGESWYAAGVFGAVLAALKTEKL